MKFKFLLCVAMALFTSAAASAKDEDPESNHVVVTLSDGSQIDGYIRNDFKTGLKNFFSKTGTIRQYINIGKERKGGETKRYSAKEVKEYRFTEATEAFPDGATFVSDYINTPGLFKPHNCKRGFAQELNRTDCGSILLWTVTKLFIDGSHSDALLLNYLKKQAPDLKKMIEEYFDKGKDAKAHRKELKENPSIILDIYADYLTNHSPLNDPADPSADKLDEPADPDSDSDSSDSNTPD